MTPGLRGRPAQPARYPAPLMPAKAGIRSLALGPRFRGDERISVLVVALQPRNQKFDLGDGFPGKPDARLALRIARDRTAALEDVFAHRQPEHPGLLLVAQQRQMAGETNG